MLPLCDALGITVNDLLSGGRVPEGEYRRRAEENLAALMRENEENKKRMALSLICGTITILAVGALVAVASFLDLPPAARVALLLLASATAAAGVGAAAVLDRGAGYFECPRCGTLFVPTMGEYVKGLHTFTRRRLTCPRCGGTGLCRRRVTRGVQGAGRASSASFSGSRPTENSANASPGPRTPGG